MPDVHQGELWDIQEAIVSRLNSELPWLQAKPADNLTEDFSWLISQPPGVLVLPTGRFRRAESQPVDDPREAYYTIPITLLWVFSGLRPRDGQHWDSGLKMMAADREVLDFYWPLIDPDDELSHLTSCPITYVSEQIAEYDRERSYQLWEQMYTTEVLQVSPQATSAGPPGGFSGDGWFSGTGEISG